MEIDEARQFLRRFQLERDRAKVMLEKAQQTFESSQIMIRGLLTGFPELADEVTDEDLAGVGVDSDDERPRGAEAVRSILQDDPGVPYRVSELVRLLRERGWLPESENPASAVRTALERLRATPKTSDIYKLNYVDGTVKYKYDPDYEGADNDEEPF
jgi:hypothetical protein